MELIYDDKTDTWGEAPEAYETIECATKEDYEYAKKAIKGYKELEAKHWDECRQIAHYEDELKEAKRLLKAAVEDFKEINSDILTCKYCKWYSAENDECTFIPDDTPCEKICGWKHEGEALALIGEGGDTE